MYKKFYHLPTHFYGSKYPGARSNLDFKKSENKEDIEWETIEIVIPSNHSLMVDMSVMRLQRYLISTAQTHIQIKNRETTPF